MVQVVPEASPSLRRTSLLPPNPRNLEAKLCPLSGNFGLAIYGRNEGAKPSGSFYDRLPVCTWKVQSTTGRRIAVGLND